MIRTFWGILELLPTGARRYLLTYSAVAAVLALIDIAALLAVIASLTILLTRTSYSVPLPSLLVNSPVLGLALACALFLIKSASGLILNFFAARRLSEYEFEFGNRVFRSYANSPWEERAKYTTAEITRMVDSSVSIASTGFIAPLLQVPGQVATFIGIFLLLLAVQPVVAIIAVFYFSGIFLIVRRLIFQKIQAASKQNRDSSFKVAVLLSEIVEALRELTLRGKLEDAGESVAEYREPATNARRALSFLGTTPKFTYEIALIGGILLTGGFTYLVNGPSAAAFTVSMFGAAAFRLIPSITSFQASLNQAQIGEPFTRDLIQAIQHTSAWSDQRSHSVDEHDAFPINPFALEMQSVCYHYPNTEQVALENIDLSIPIGSRFGIVGPSGAGKSTLIDTLLGLSRPTSGLVTLDGMDIGEFLSAWRSKIGYVSQQVALFDGTLAQNIALSWGDDIDFERVVRALEQAQATELLRRPGGVNSLLGERGSALSGGQQQRVGIARALYTDPLILILDEATSALDTSTENGILESLDALSGDLTLITVAHRLATIRDYEQLCYISDGRVMKTGSFEELVAAVPDFAAQARLAGLA